MGRVTAVRRAGGKPRSGRILLLLVVLAASLPLPRAHAQTAWNDSTTRALVGQAIRRRAEQLADTALVDYRANAHGYLTFLAQVGQGFIEPPRIVKADELELEVYWRAPNLSKQRIIGRRDTLLLPTDIAYHRDHLGIVQNNFPAIIRLGDGDEVRDVPHPLSAAGDTAYDFAISDSLRIHLPGRDVNVYEVKVRPRDDRAPRVVGAVYIDRAEGQVVRMTLSFTRAAFIDTQLEDLSIVLENGLVSGRFWLPRRQEVEIRRTGTWLDYPVRGIIRGRWEIADYRLNTRFNPGIFVGPEIVQAPVEEQRRYAWPNERLLDSLPPDVRAVTDADVRRVQAEARALVRSQALQRARTLSVSARGVSDLVRVDRVEGLSVGSGLSQPLGNGFLAGARARYGVDDRDVKWQGRLEWQSGAGVGVRLFAQRDFRELGDEPERSRVLNSLAAQEFGSDYTDPFRVAGGGIALSLAAPSATTWELGGSVQRTATLDLHATPVSGRYLGVVPVNERRSVESWLRIGRPASLTILGGELRAALELRVATSVGAIPAACHTDCASFATLRGGLVADLERPIGARRLVLHSAAAAVGGRDGIVPAQSLAYFGGPVTGAGYEYHELVGRAAWSQRVEWRTPIQFLSVPLGRFGTLPRTALLAPYAQVVALDRPSVDPVRFPGSPPRVSGAYPSVGVGLLTLFDLLRFDVARGLRGGRWAFSVDVAPYFWPVL